jgi:hypothetical protein
MRFFMTYPFLSSAGTALLISPEEGTSSVFVSSSLSPDVFCSEMPTFLFHPTETGQKIFVF